MLNVLFAEPFRSKKPFDFPRIANAIIGEQNRVRYHAQSVLFHIQEDRYYVPTYAEAVDILKWAGVVIA